MRRLTRDEAALWQRLAATVRPLHLRRNAAPAVEPAVPGDDAKPVHPLALPRTPSIPPAAVREQPKRPPTLDRSTLDASWDRKLGKGVIHPDFALDLHGHTLESAHARLDHGLTQALAQGARVLLLITGKERPSDDHAGRGSRRGAIRAKVLDWLAAGPHASRIAAVRPAHPRHGGAGALYIVLRRGR